MKKYCILLVLILIIPSILTACGNSDINVSISEDGSGVVLMYHLLTEDSTQWSDFCVSPQLLEKDIQYFIDKGYTFVTPTTLQKMNDNYVETLNNPGRFVMLTFDDGYESDYQYVFPLLKKYNVPATFFLPGSNLGMKDYVTIPQICEMSKSGLAEYGNHGNRIHREPKASLRKLYKNEKNLEYVVNDFEQNERIITNIIDKKPASIAYPYGAYTEEIEQTFRKKFGVITFSTQYGITTLPLGNRPIKRMNRAFSLDLKKIAK